MHKQTFGRGRKLSRLRISRAHFYGKHDIASRFQANSVLPACLSFSLNFFTSLARGKADEVRERAPTYLPTYRPTYV